ncbi:MAG TPA: hypothetical protein VFV95_09250 [Vicinamibacterales bacterium]|nr:hypothetical protein [Vicinamibacterales bacterium]
MRRVGYFIVVASFALPILVALSGLSGSVEARNSLLPQGKAVREGREIFRHDTFGDEQLWTDVLRMHEVIPKAVSPNTALKVGLKVDSQALPRPIVRALKAGEVDLDDPAITVALLQLNAVVGLEGTVDDAGHLTSVGVTCALCHSTVDDSFAPGIGRRLDGWPNRDLNVGAIAALSPFFDKDPDTRDVLNRWGPGMYDARHHAFDGVNLIVLNPQKPSLPVLIPPIYGLLGVGFETYTGDGPISYWNSYVGVGQMGGHGTFVDPRIGLNITQTPDMVTPKLPALLAYQLSLQAPKPRPDAFNRNAARRGRQLFNGDAGCAGCHQAPHFTDVLSGVGGAAPVLHDPGEVGTEEDYAARSATGQYRTTPLRGLVAHPPYFHDGSAPDLAAVVEHYDRQFRLGLTPAQKADLVEYLKSL